MSGDVQDIYLEPDALRARIADLRKAMAYAINHAGGAVSDDCSHEFLCLGAEQVKLYVDRLAAENERLREALRDVRDTVDNGDLNRPLCLRDRITLGDGKEAHEDLDEILDMIDSG